MNAQVMHEGELLAAQVMHERDLWAAQTREALASGVQAVMRLSARLPAALRTRGLADGPVGSGVAAFQAECRRMDLVLRHLGPGRGALGPWVLWTSDNDPLLLKQAAVLVEEGSRQGQLLDLDVYSKDGPVSRSMLGFPPRPCIVCGEAAAVCSGRAIHSTATVQAAFLALLGHSSSTSSDPVPVLSKDLRTDTPLALNRP